MSGLCCVLHRLIKRRWCSQSSVRAGASPVSMSCRAALAPAAASMVTCARAQVTGEQVLRVNKSAQKIDQNCQNSAGSAG